MQPLRPEHIDLKKDRGLAIRWQDGSGSYYSIRYLRRMSPSADMIELRRAIARNPLTVLPAGASSSEEISAVGAELVGNYAIRIRFSDGHESGIYTWEYLHGIDPERGGAPGADGLGPLDHGPSHDRPLGL